MLYKTEIHVTADRYVCLQLPDYLPEGRAMVTVTISARDPLQPETPLDGEPDDRDFEWWEEFDEEVGRRSRR